MLSKADIERYKQNMQEEINTAAIYRALADKEQHAELQSVYRKLAETEERHARFWRDKLAAQGLTDIKIKPDWRARTLSFLARRFGPQLILPTLMEAERAGSNQYRNQPEAAGTPLASEEHSHNKILRAMTESTPRGIEGSMIARLEGRHRNIGGNALRAAVLGANDGLVSNLSLVMGVAGAELSSQNILITGMAGLLAGAISMALGEWLSVQSSREYYQKQIEIEAQELAVSPMEEAEELALIYQAKGLPEDQARIMAQKIIADPDKALDTLAREELGIDPEELGGSAWEAAFTSFILFALGAIFPVAPFLFLTGQAAVLVSLSVSGLALFAIGAAITLMTGRSILLSGLRQLGFGLAAAGVTYAIGWLLGVQISG